MLHLIKAMLSYMNQKFSAIAMISSAVAASALFSIVTLANPPSGTPGTTSGAIAATSTGGFWSVTINGTTTIQKSLDMAGNRITGVATPVTSTDAVNLAYITAPSKLWGEGRSGTMILNASGVAVTATTTGSGECTVSSVRVGRVTSLAAWNGASSACPANWWVCSATERGAAACGSGVGLPKFGDCFINTASGSIDSGGYGRVGIPASTTFAWVADKDAATFNGMSINAAGSTAFREMCSQYPVWCCK